MILNFLKKIKNKARYVLLNFKKRLSEFKNQIDNFNHKSALRGFPLRKNERDILNLKWKENGKRIFILGNGPSLNSTDVDLLCGDVSIASNAVFLLFDRKKFRPTYYTIEDYLVAEDRAQEASSYKHGWKIFPNDLKKFIKSDRLTMFINFQRNYQDFPKFSDNFLNSVFWGGTVTYMNLQLAYYLGAKEIYLIGFDHNYSSPAISDKVNGPVITSMTEDINHFDPRYFGSGYRWHDPKVERMEEGYIYAKKFLESKGVKVFNATRGGKLEVFERVDFDSLF